MKTSEKILNLIKEYNEVSPNMLYQELGVSRRAIFKQLNTLLKDSKIIKVGSNPKVFYKLSSNEPERTPINLDMERFERIEENFLYITPLGEAHKGVEGFVKWCSDRGLNAESQAEQYIKFISEIDSHKKYGVIDASDKFKGTFDQSYLDQVFYIDFYSIPQFGKTKLGQLLLYAKQSQDSKRIKEISTMVKDKIDSLIDKYKVDAVGFIPPTVKRETQFMKELERNLNIPLPKVAITKVKTEIIVPQKTLKNLEDRIINADNTLIVEETHKFNNILLIDDATGSGATLQQVAKKIKRKSLAKKVYGLALVGSYKGFEVISEV